MLFTAHHSYLTGYRVRLTSSAIHCSANSSKDASCIMQITQIVSILRMPIFRDFKNSRKQVFVSHQNLITVAGVY